MVPPLTVPIRNDIVLNPDILILSLNILSAYTKKQKKKNKIE